MMLSHTFKVGCVCMVYAGLSLVGLAGPEGAGSKSGRGLGPSSPATVESSVVYSRKSLDGLHYNVSCESDSAQVALAMPVNVSKPLPIMNVDIISTTGLRAYALPPGADIRLEWLVDSLLPTIVIHRALEKKNGGWVAIVNPARLAPFRMILRDLFPAVAGFSGRDDATAVFQNNNVLPPLSSSTGETIRVVTREVNGRLQIINQVRSDVILPALSEIVTSKTVTVTFALAAFHPETVLVEGETVLNGTTCSLELMAEVGR